MNGFIPLFSTITLCVLCPLVTAGENDWLQWRGNARDGQSAGAAWPGSLDEAHLVRKWRVELPPSYSGPIISKDQVFTTETANKENEIVRSLNLADGKEIWNTGWEGVMKVPFFAKSNGSWIRSTPASDGEVLVVAGMRDVLVCIDPASGKKKWHKDFVNELGTDMPSFGFASSPLIDGNAVFVQAGASLIKLNKQDGKVIWRSLEDAGGMNGSAFSSPCVATIAGVRQLLVQTRSELCGVGIDQGKVLWKLPIEAFRNMNILTPVVSGDLIFTSAYGGKTLGIQVGREGDTWDPEVKWELKMEGYMSTPVVVDGHAYMHLRNQRFACVEVATGQEKWITKKKFGKYWSMIARGGEILALDQRGKLYHLRANPEKFDVISEREVSESETWAHLAISGDRLVIRELDAVSVFEWKVPSV